MTNGEAKHILIGNATDYQLREVIGLQTVKVGIDAKRIPEADKQIILKWVRSYYKQLSLFDFSNAFNMAINGQLEADANCYGKFTIHYIGNILRAYIAHRIASGQIVSSFDAQRRPLNYDVDRSQITPMGDAVNNWVNELKEKGKEKLRGNQQSLDI